MHPYAQDAARRRRSPIVVCGDPGDAKWAVLWDQDCSACTENLLIEAELLGLGAVWLGIHPLAGARDRRCARCSASPSTSCPFAVVPFGWPAERKEPSDRYDAARVHTRALVRRGRGADGSLRCALARGYLCHSTRDAAGAALRPGAGETGPAPRVAYDDGAGGAKG